MESDKQMGARVREHLAMDPRTNILDVSVRIVGDQVFLIGPVLSGERRCVAEEVAREIIPSGMRIVNELWTVDHDIPDHLENLG